MANDARQHLLGAHSLCALTAESRPKLTGLAALDRKLGIE
jgi:hypothetical protein